MAWKLKWPLLGVIIPCLVIVILGYGSHWFLFRLWLSGRQQFTHQTFLTLVWISYAGAILKSPGHAPTGFRNRAGQWKRWCRKCSNHKPERAHHCKSCNACVLKMDHHCPWTYNCVGHGNMPHFLRFLFWVLVATGYVLYHLTVRLAHFYHDRDLPAYLINKSELAACIALWPLDLFVWVSIAILYGRCLLNMAFRGMTQIEVWDRERMEGQIHTARMWKIIRNNYRLLHGKPMPPLVSWSRSSAYSLREEQEEQEEEEQEYDQIESYPLRKRSPARESNSQPIDDTDTDDESVPDITIDDIVFPYDMGIWQNIVDACGYPWNWLLPWGGPSGNGYEFPMNDDDDQIGLPWPPDGGHQNAVVQGTVYDDQQLRLMNIGAIRKHLDPRANMKRSQWRNDLGETLDDYGVDVADESEEDVKIEDATE